MVPLQRFIASLAGMLMLLGAGFARADDAPPLQEPQLRIEAGMHVANIKGIDVSADGRLMVTGSEDKTVRLWSLPDGKLTRVYRLPIEPGDYGKIYSVALSPDERLIAAGGWDAYHSANYVYLIDTLSGSIVKRLGPLASVIDQVIFSPDGERLAAGLHGKNGVRLWQAPFDAAPLSDEDFGRDGNGSVYGLSFNQRGDLAATSEDHYIRLYDGALKLQAMVKTEADFEPQDIAFSPDGTKLAVAHYDAARIDIRDAQTLAVEYSADTSSIDNGSLSTVAWSADGETIFAGGSFDVGGVSPVVAWPDQGRGKAQIGGGALNTIIDLAPLPDGGAVFASSDPAFGIVGHDGVLRPVKDSEGDSHPYRGPVTADMRTKRSGNFWSAPDASGVWFGLERGGDIPWRFDLNELAFQPLGERPSGYIEPQTDTLPIEDWMNGYSTLDKQVLALESYERTRSLAIAPDAKSFVVGAEWSIRRFGADGKQIWRTPVEGVAWGVNLSSDGSIIIAALGDGTIRWYRASDGVQLLAFFVHAPDKRWIAWTPKGYYAASPGGEDLIGWHVNGKTWDDTPDFFPASRFRQHFYRPDIVKLVVKTGDEDKAVEEANAAAQRKPEDGSIAALLPPVIDIVADSRNIEARSGEIALTYRLRSPSGRPVTRVEARIDGQLAGSRGFTAVDDGYPLDQELTVTVPVPPRDSTVSLIAFSDQQASVPASIAVAWRGAASTGPKPKLFALLVGISDYDEDALKLRYAAKDANDLAAALKTQEGKFFEHVETVVLVDHKASENKIEVELSRLRKKVGPNDYALVFMAGHGVTDAQGGFHFLPADASLAEDELEATSLNGIVIRESLRTIQAKVLLFMDACHAGRGIEGDRARADMTGFANDLSQDSNGVVMFASSTGREVSYEDSRWQNGAFTDALLATLSDPEAFGKDGLLSISELDEELSSRVLALTDNRQNAVMTKPNAIPRFFLAALH